MKKAKFVIICALCIFQFKGLIAQDNGLPLGFAPNVPSPNAWSFAKYGEIPVDEHTGVPDITIPVYTLKDGSIELPITLRYHAGGIKVEEEASWVGLSWNLNVGGVITRIANGLPDYDQATAAYYQFQDLDNSVVFYPKRRYCSQYEIGCSPPDISFTNMWNQHCCLFQAEWDTIYGNMFSNAYNAPFEYYSSFKSSCFCNDEFSYMWNYIINGFAQTDQYSFIIPGCSGTFYIDYGRTGQTEISYHVMDKTLGLKIEGENNLEQWTITDKSGIKYIFEDVETALTSYDPYSYVSSTYLTQILYPDGDYVSFDYYTGPSISSGSEIETLNGNGSINATIPTKAISPKHINRITTKNYTIQFNRNEGFTRQDIVGESCLTSIVVSSKSNTALQKRFEFTYHHSVSPTPDQGTCAVTGTPQDQCNKRIVLDEFRSIESGNVNKYTFTYNAGILPAKNSFARDYWGYYNGCTTNTSLLPNKYRFFDFNMESLRPGFQLVDYPAGTAIRCADSNYIGAGMISKITYPTGGYTTYEFGPHKFVNAYYDQARPIMYSKYLQDINNSQYDDSVFIKTFTSPGIVYLSGSIAPGQQNYPFSIMQYAYIRVYDNNVILYEWKLNGATSQINSMSFDGVNFGVSPSHTYKFVVSLPNSLPDQYGSSYGAQSRLTVQYKLKSPFSIGGGMRVNRIASYSANGILAHQKIYQYEENGNYYGQVLVPINYWKIFNINDETNPGDRLLKIRQEFSGSNISLSTTGHGGTVAYSKVIISENDAKSNGKIEKYFNLYPYAYIADEPSIPTLSDPLNGKLVKEMYYENGNTNLVKEIDYQWVKDYSKYYYYYTAFGQWINRLVCFSSGTYEDPIIKDEYIAYLYPMVSAFVTMNTKSTYDYYNGNTVTTIDSNTYNDLGQLIKTVTRSSDNLPVRIETYYPYEKKVPGNIAQSMFDNHVFNLPFEQRKYFNNINTETTRIGYVSKGVLQTGAAECYVPSTIDQAKDGITFRTMNNLTYSSGNLIQEVPLTGSPTSYIWGYQGTLLVAKAANCMADKFAATSFESVEGTTSGNFTINPAKVYNFTDGSRTGRYFYELSSVAKVVYNIPSSTNQYYYLSFWANSGNIPTVTASGGQVTPVILWGTITKNGWNLCKFLLYTTAGSTVTISAPIATIDDVRLYPKGAQVTTYTYEPLYDVTSVTDENDVTSYYVYDANGRLAYIKDNDGNVLKWYEYNYAH